MNGCKGSNNNNKKEKKKGCVCRENGALSSSQTA